MKNFNYIFFILFNILFSTNNINFYDLVANTISGEKITMEKFRGKKILIVNVASK